MEAAAIALFIMGLLLLVRWCALPQLRRMHANRQARKAKHYNKLARAGRLYQTRIPKWYGGGIRGK